MVIALGEIYSGVFSTSDTLWEELHAAGEVEHDRFWRMPLEDEYGPQIYSSNADLQNVSAKKLPSIPLADTHTHRLVEGRQVAAPLPCS